MPAGRPTKFTNELFDSICDIISQSNRGLVSICKEKGINAKTFFDWIKDSAELSNKYARAKEMQAEYLAEEMLSIADDSANDNITTENGEIPNNEWINRSRLRVDTRKWLASKLFPKKYGDKVEVDNQVTVKNVPDWLKNAPDGSKV